MVELQALDKNILNGFTNNTTCMRCLLDFYIQCYHKPGGPTNSIKQMDLLKAIKDITIPSFERHHFCVQPCLISGDGLLYGPHHS